MFEGYRRMRGSKTLGGESKTSQLHLRTRTVYYTPSKSHPSNAATAASGNSQETTEKRCAELPDCRLRLARPPLHTTVSCTLGSYSRPGALTQPLH